MRFRARRERWSGEEQERRRPPSLLEQFASERIVWRAVLRSVSLSGVWGAYSVWAVYGLASLDGSAAPVDMLGVLLLGVWGFLAGVAVALATFILIRAWMLYERWVTRPWGG